MDQMEKIWQKVDSLEESRIRHDERIRQNEQQTNRALKEVVRLEGDLNAKFEALTNEIRNGFILVGKRIDDLEAKKKKDEGYAAGVKETRVSMLKHFGVWLTTLTFLAGVVMWRLSQ